MGAALIEAIRSGRLPIIEWLLDNGADVNAEYHDQIGPLELALRYQQPEVVYLLVKAGARLRTRTRPYYAARLEECLKALGHATRSVMAASNKRGSTTHPGKRAKKAPQPTSSTRKTSKSQKRSRATRG